MDEETLEILLEAHAEGIHELNRVQDAISDVRDAVLELNDSLWLVSTAFLAEAAAEEVATRAQRQHNDATRDATPIVGGLAAAFGGLLGGIGGFLFQAGPLVDIIVVLTIALAPVIPMVIGATAAVAGFALGLAAALTVMTLAGATVVALGAGMVVLAEMAFQANQKLQNPLAKVEADLKKMAETWEKSAAPMAAAILNWADALVPRVTAAGVAIEQWFGARLPGFLQEATRMFNIFWDAAVRVSQTMGTFVDQVGTRMPVLGPLLDNVMIQMTGAIQGLLDNLLRLSDWFTARLPTLGPIVGQIFSGIGAQTQNLLSWFGRLVDWTVTHWPELNKTWKEFWDRVGPILGALIDAGSRAVTWFVANWPRITALLQQTWTNIKAGWDQVAPIIGVMLPAVLHFAADAMDYLSKHGQLVHDTLMLLGFIAGVTVIALFILITALFAVAVALVWLYQKFLDVTTAISSFFNWITGGIIGGIDNLAQHIWNAAAAVEGLIGAMLRIPRGGIGGASGGGTGAGGGGANGGEMLTFDYGGMVPGPTGTPRLAIVHGGEEVLTPEQQRARGRGGPVVLEHTTNLIVDGELMQSFFERMVDERVASQLSRT